MLAHPEGMEPQNFLQLAHGQPFLWQRGFLHLPVESAATTALRRPSNPMAISVPNYGRNTDRFRIGMLIAITSES
jgi:hypothetical protein